MLLVALAFRGLPASAASALHASTNATVLRALSTPRNHYFAPKPSAAALAHAQSQRLAPASKTNTKSPLSPVPGGGPLTSIRTSWEGIPSDFTLDPPDPSGAAGPNGILATVNERIAYFDKSGNAIWGPISHAAFFGQASGVVVANLLGDPHTLYDPGSGRFFTHVLEIDFNGNQSHLALAVSKNSNPTTSTSADWFFYRIDDLEPGNPTAWTDYPADGFDSQAYYITFNMFTLPINSSTFTNAEILALDKNALINGTTNYTFTFVDGFTLQPCSVLSSNTPGNVAFFGETLFFVDQTHVRITALSSPLSAPTVTSTLVSVPDNGGYPPFGGAPQPGTGLTIDTLDGRCEGNAFYYNGNVWFCHTAGGTSGKAIVYYYNVALNGYPGGTPTLVQEGTLDGGPGEWTYQPNIGCNALGDVGIVYSQSSGITFPSIYGSTRKAAALNFDTPALIKASPSYYFGFGRWGDFASVTADPVDQTFWMTHEWARSSKLIDWGTWWANLVAKTGPNLTIATNYLTSGNLNGLIDPNECNDVIIVLTNTGSFGATNIQATLSTTTPGVILAQRTSTYRDLPVGSGSTNVNLFKISTTPDFLCGTPVKLSMVVKSDQDTQTNLLTLISGSIGREIRFDSTNVPVPIPDDDLAGVDSSVLVSNITSVVGKVTVSLHIPHQFVSDLALSLIGPDGTTNVLSANHGGFFSHDYGVDCVPDGARTTFDDASTNPISAGFAPFVGTYAPDQRLAVFSGKSGTNINGLWRLHAVDSLFFFTGTIECWSLSIFPAQCTDGGGECPGVDLAVGMIAAPEPVFIGSNLVYSITVTNFGPGSAKNTVLSEVLDSSLVFVSATVSQGNVSYSGGVVTATLGKLNVGATATATVVVTPTIAKLVSSTASVSSSDTEVDPSNNSITVFSHVNPPLADLAVGLFDNPDPVLIGQTLTYIASVTNRGPAAAGNVRLTNTLPASVTILDAIPSQGSAAISTASNQVICSFGALPNAAVASVTIHVTPFLEGNITATAAAGANQTDPFLNNNTASATTTVGPSADLTLALTASPDPVVLRSNLTYTINVTNRGPSVATGVLVNDTLPPGVTLVSTNTTQGTISIGAGAVTANLGTLVNGGRATVTIVISSTNVGSLTDSATVSAAQSDPNPANNSASVTTSNAAPFLLFAAAGANIVPGGESFAPPNGTIDPGETVTLRLFLKNVGNVSNTNLIATLLATNGVTSPSAPQSYDFLGPGEIKGRSFTFTASGTNGGLVIATLQLVDNGTYVLPPVSFTFSLPALSIWANTNRIDVPTTAQDQQLAGPASPFPSSIVVSGVTGQVGHVTVTLSDLTHTFPHDLNVLLVGPLGQKVLLMSDAADGSSVSDANVTFDDSAAAPLPSVGQVSPGSWQPSAYDFAPLFSNPAPAPPYGTALSAFNGASPNGTWSLFLNDDSDGDFGNIAQGWSLAFTTLTPISDNADLSLTAASSPNPVLVGNSLTTVYTITNAGPNNVVIVTFTNPLPANASFVSATASQGAAPVTNAARQVTCNLGTLTAGSSATVTVLVSPTAPGQVTNSATVTANSGEVDLNLANNSASTVTTANLPLADVAIANAAAPSPAVVGATLTNTIALTNNGPNNALNVAVTDTLPASVTFVSANPLNYQLIGSQLTFTNLGTLASGSSAVLTVVVTPTSPGQLTNTATVSTYSTDGNSANNSATTITAAANPAPLILPAGAALVSEPAPGNAAIDPNETVTVSLTLTNAGAARTTNLVATLLAANGVTSPSGPQTYGALTNGGASVASSFTFTASAVPPGGVVVATLQLQDGPSSLGTASFTFSIPVTTTSASTNAIIIPDHGPAAPYPSTINVSGLSGLVSKVTVTLNAINHSFPRDINALLVSPAGGNALFLSHAGGGHALTNVTLTFADAASTSLPNGTQISGGTYKPSAYPGPVTFPVPAPSSGSYGSSLAFLNGGSPNGAWSLYVFDDSPGDQGNIAGGWTLNLTTVSNINPVADLAVTVTDAPDPIFTLSTLTYTIAVTNRGPSAATGVVLSDTLPQNVSVISTNISQGSAAIVVGGVSFNLGTLNSGAGALATIRVSPSLEGTLTNTASVTANQTDLDLANNVAQALTTVLSPRPAVLDITPLGNQRFLISLTAEPGLTYSFQVSSNFGSWNNVFTATASANGAIRFNTTNSPTLPRRFYRALRIP